MAGRGVDLQRAPQELNTFLQTEQPIAAAPFRAASSHAATVVGHRQPDALRRIGERDLDMAGLGMFAHIGQPLLRHAIEREFRLRVE